MSENETKDVAVVSGGALDFTRGFTPEQKQLLKEVIVKVDCTDQELQLFMYQCVRRRLDPFTKQIYAIKRWDSAAGKKVLGFQTGIDGFRAIAERTGKYRGQVGPEWCGKDGVWKDVWLGQAYPEAARVGVIREGCTTPIWGVALWKEYVQLTQDNKVTQMWHNMSANQLAKCAESLALRKAFPEDLGGLYTSEEMDQSDRDGDGRTKAETMQSQIEGTQGPKITPRQPLPVHGAPGEDLAGPPTGNPVLDWIVPGIVKPIAGRRIGAVSLDELRAAVKWAQDYFNKEKKQPTGRWAEFFDKAVAVFEYSRPDEAPAIEAEFKEVPEPGADG